MFMTKIADTNTNTLNILMKQLHLFSILILLTFSVQNYSQIPISSHPLNDGGGIAVPKDSLTKKTTVKTVTIKGSVTDEKDEPIPFVSVWITYPSSPSSIIKSEVTTKRGEFTLAVPENKEYILTIKMLGYSVVTKKFTTVEENIDLGCFKLSVDAVTLKEVTIRPPVTVTADKIIFNFENDPDRPKSNMLDMIRKVPLILIDPFDDKIYIESPQKTYTVLRKGRVDAQFSSMGIKFEEMLQKLPAMGFTTFEIWTVVPERYAGFDYVINILPDPTQRLFGAVGANEARYNAREGELSLSQSVNGSADIIRFTGNFSFLNSNSPKTKGKSSILFYPTDEKEELLILQEDKEWTSGETYNAGLLTSIDITKKQFINLGFKGNIQDNSTTKNTDTDSLFGGISARMLNRYYSTSVIKNWELNADYQLEFDKQERHFNISYYMLSVPTKKDSRLSTIYENSANNGRLTSNKQSDITHRLQFDYDESFGKYNFSSRAGYLVTNYDGQNRVLDMLTNVENEDAYTRLQQEIHRLDGFASLRYNPVKRLSISTTVRSDYLLNDFATTATTGNNLEKIAQKRFLIGGGFGGRFNFNLKLPKKMMMQMMSANQANSSISLYYNLNRSRPSTNLLTNYEDINNPFYIRRGNPNLKVENEHNLRMDFICSWGLSQSLIYNFYNNKIVNTTVLETNENGTRLVTTYDNSGKHKGINYMASYSNIGAMMRPPRSFDFFLVSTMVFCNIINTDYGNGISGKLSIFVVNTNWSLNIQKFRSSITFGYNDMRQSGAYGGKTDNPFSLVFGFTKIHKIGDNNLSYNISINNILNQNYQRHSTINMPDFERSFDSSKLRIPVIFSIRYNYGNFKVKPLRKSRNSATVEGFSTIEKVE